MYTHVLTWRHAQAATRRPRSPVRLGARVGQALQGALHPTAYRVESLEASAVRHADAQVASSQFRSPEAPPVCRWCLQRQLSCSLPHECRAHAAYAARLAASALLPRRPARLGARLRKRLRPARLTRRGRTWCAWARAGRRSLHHRLDPAGHQGRPARAWPGGPACALDAARGSMQRQLDCSRPRNGQAHAARLAGSAP